MVFFLHLKVQEDINLITFFFCKMSNSAICIFFAYFSSSCEPHSYESCLLEWDSVFCF